MAYETVVAVFDTVDHAKTAMKALTAGGFHETDVSIFDKTRLGDQSRQESGLWGRLFGGDMYKHEAEVYGKTVAEGGAVLSARVLDSEVAHATGILNTYRPIDVHDRAMTSNIAPASHVETAAKSLASMPMAAMQQTAVSPKLAEAHSDVLRLAEEQLQVGKEMAETGRTRVRRFTTEREVTQDITLHEEHAEVMRRAVDQSAQLGDINWADDEIEVIETAEHARVSKTARLVEELELKKVGVDHVETVHEKLRRQQAEVIKVGADGKPMTTSANR